MKKSLLAGLFLSGLLLACSTDVDVNAPYEDVTVIFGLLDASDTAQYIKVNKAFLGEDDALIMASEEDSLYYAEGSLTVELVEIINGNEVKTIALTRDESIEKDPGVFANPNQVLFKTTEALNENARYALRVVKNGPDAITSTAETQLVQDFNFLSPLNNPSYKFNFTNRFSAASIPFQTAENGRRYECTIRFHYVEENRANRNDTIEKFIEWTLDPFEADDLGGGRERSFSFPGSSFYKVVANRIQPDLTVWRHPKKVDVIIDVAGDEFSTYLDLNGPSSTIAQDKPEFSNIDNGVGLFSSRFQKVREGIAITGPSQDSLQCSEATQGLSFVTYEVIPASNQVDTIFTCQ